MEEQSFDIRPYLEMFKRQRLLVFCVFSAFMALVVLVAVLWPATYRSTATILVEEQQIPENLVRSTITTFVDERIQVISQRALTQANLGALSDRHRLYPKLRQYQTSDEIIERLRSNIAITTVTANMARSGGRATIAFKVSFKYEDPRAAQAIVGDLTTIFLDENVKARQRTTAETSTFLQDEAQRLYERVNEIEEQIEAFKTRHAGRLPEQVEINGQMIERMQLEIERLSRELVSLDDRRSFIQVQIASLPEGAPPALAGGAPPVPGPLFERLRTARLQLAAMSGVYSEDHPDHVRLVREIAGLETLVASDRLPGTATGPAPGKGGGGSNPQLEEMRVALASGSQRFSPDHPDMVDLKRRIDAIERSEGTVVRVDEGAQKAVGVGAVSEGIRNQAQSNMQAHLEGTLSRIRAVESEREDLRRRLVDYERRASVAPAIEREFITLTRDHTNSLARYRELQSKLLEAEIGQELERDRKAERFTLIEPALMPQSPVSPNRPAIVLMGLLLALGTSLGAGILRELLDPTIKSLLDADLISAVPVLAAIPIMRSSVQLAARRARLRYGVLALVAGVAVAAAVVHIVVMPLNVLWHVLRRQIEAIPGFFL